MTERPHTPTTCPDPARFCLRCGYALLESMTAQACPECGQAFDLDSPQTTSPSPKRLRRFWRRRSRLFRLALVFLVFSIPLGIAVMEYRHSQVRAIETGGHLHDIYIDWSWTMESDPAFYGRCVHFEWWLREKGDLGQFTANNLERIRRRLRSNFSPIERIVVIDSNSIYLSDEKEFEQVRAAMYLARARGATVLEWYGWQGFGPADTVLHRDNDIGRRAQAILELAEHLGLEIR